MFVNIVNSLLLIVYIIKADFQVLILERDNNFISRCLPLLKYSYYRHLIPEIQHIDYENIKDKIYSKGFLKYNTSIETKSTLKKTRRRKIIPL